MVQTGKKRILVAASTESAETFADHADFLRDWGFEVAFVTTALELLQAMLLGQAHLVVVYCGPLDLPKRGAKESLPEELRKPKFIGNRAGFNTVALARQRGSQTPALFLVSGFYPTAAVSGTVVCEVPITAERLLEMVQVALRLVGTDTIVTLAITKRMMRRSDSGRVLL